MPTCPNWRQDPKEISITVDVVVFLSYFTGFAVSISILVISVLRHKSMLVDLVFSCRIYLASATRSTTLVQSSHEISNSLLS